jgi:hypothetical protein
MACCCDLPQLANLDNLPQEQAAKLPSVRRLRDAIYSPEFRNFISQITGCPGGGMLG